MFELMFSHLLFFFAGIGVAGVLGAIVIAHRDSQRPAPEPQAATLLPEPEPTPVPEPEPLPEPEPDRVPTPALVLTTGLYPALADLHEPPAPQLPTHEWWLEQTAPYQLIEEPPHEPIPDPDVLTGRQRWANGPIVHARPNGISLLSPLTPGDPTLRVCDLVLAAAA